MVVEIEEEIGRGQINSRNWLRLGLFLCVLLSVVGNILFNNDFSQLLSVEEWYEYSMANETSFLWLANSIEKHQYPGKEDREKLEERQGIPRLPVIPKPDPFPEFEQIETSMKAGNLTSAQFILDIAIIGFAKCGTSTMMRWLGQHPEINIPPKELNFLKRHEPWQLLAYFYTEFPKDPKLMRGYKAPSDINDIRPIRLLSVFFPETKLIIGMRHPIWMLQSLYNFRIQNGVDIVPFEKIQRINFKESKMVYFNRARYHDALANLGKTKLSSEEEWQYFSKDFRLKIEKKRNTTGERTPALHRNKVFLYDIEQLSDKNEARLSQFLLDLKNYLGLTRDLPPPIKQVPGREISAEIQEQRSSLKINVCDEKYAEQRQLLVKYGTQAQAWILDYFLASPDVMVSNPNHFRKVLESYQHDPCAGQSSNTTVS